jgi:hypothetical protein
VTLNVVNVYVNVLDTALDGKITTPILNARNQTQGLLHARHVLIF